MALVLQQQVETTLPIEVAGILPEKLAGLSHAEIAKQRVGYGNREEPLGELFRVSGSLTADNAPTIRWEGSLTSVHWIGANMQSGRMEVESSAGRHLGSQMTGGEIVTKGDVSDYLGAEMTGGTIRVSGNAGDLVGANYPGSKFGLNRGNIFISGNAGKGVGQSMKRGAIVIGGDCGKLAGWDMLAGTLVVFGHCDQGYGASMIRGTIVLAAEAGQERPTLPTFSSGGTDRVPVLGMLARWLNDHGFDCDHQRLVEQRFTQYHGDILRGGRGEVFLLANDRR